MDLFSKPKPAEPKALSVTQLLRRMKNLLEVQLGSGWVEGEVSNLKKQGSGHWYFSLKDAGAQIQCAMFGARSRTGSEALEDGAKVRVWAEASVYEARGQLQIIVQRVERSGAGDLQAKVEALKQKLAAEGLFDAARKRAIPVFPRVIGIVTSETGAAIRDMENVLGRRAPWVQVVLMPVRVQGKGAEVEIARAVERFGRWEELGIPRCDVLIVGRGGGSLEDLWCFNEEVVARAIAGCPIPVISAVGHEIDFTIADFVADLRAPTPSAAAELAVPDGEELRGRLMRSRQRVERAVRDRLEEGQAVLEGLRRRMLRRDAERVMREPVMRLDGLRSRMEQVVARRLEGFALRVRELQAAHRGQHPLRVLDRQLVDLAALRDRMARRVAGELEGREREVNRLRGMVRALGPESAFQRGFSITLDEEGNALRSVAGVKAGGLLRTRVMDGEVESRVVGSEK
jgi:exodeoxyribonuclease VII large subunit